MTDKSNEGPQIYRIDIEDVFGPSYAEVGATDEDELKSHRTRMVLHNSHIVSQILPASLDAARSLGCPVLLPNLSLAAARESEDFLKDAIGSAGQLSERYDEVCVEWLCLKIYLHFAQVALVLKQENAKFLHICDHTIVLGATCRELELAIMHKRTVETRKKTNDRLAYQNEGRAELNEGRKQLAHQKIAHAQKLLNSISSPNLTNSSLARLIHDRWGEGKDPHSPPPPSKRTLENWLSCKKLSRTHPSV